MRIGGARAVGEGTIGDVGDGVEVEDGTRSAVGVARSGTSGTAILGFAALLSMR